MDLQLIQKLNQMTTSFYTTHAESFSVTRQEAWSGWEELVPYMRTLAQERLGSMRVGLDGTKFGGAEPGKGKPSEKGALNTDFKFKVADFACGNLRFEQFCEARLAGIPLHFYVFDACDDLLAQAARISSQLTVHRCDLIEEALLGAGLRAEALELGQDSGEAPACKLHQGCVVDRASAIASPFAFAADKPFEVAVSFGFLHHIPSYSLRLQYMCSLAQSVVCGGLLIVSCWQFMKDERLAAKAKKIKAELVEQGVLSSEEFAQLEPGDEFLGWKKSIYPVRACHHFSEEELDCLVDDLKPLLRLKKRFWADGKQGNLNSYLVFERCD